MQYNKYLLYERIQIFNQLKSNKNIKRMERIDRKLR